jgi:hypothetical protein
MNDADLVAAYKGKGRKKGRETKDGRKDGMTE